LASTKRSRQRRPWPDAEQHRNDAWPSGAGAPCAGLRALIRRSRLCCKPICGIRNRARKRLPTPGQRRVGTAVWPRPASTPSRRRSGQDRGW